MTNQSSPRQQTAESLVDIAAQLEQDFSGNAAREMLAVFESEAAPLEAALREPLAPTDYERSQAMYKALRAAQDVIRSAWEEYHPGKNLVL
jgi:hypothetical protein